MKCPRCSAAIVTPPDAAGLFVCAGCGTRLKRVPAAARPETLASVKAEPAPPARSAEGEAPDPDALLARLDRPSPTKTLPPGTPRKPIPRPEEGGAARDGGLAAIFAELLALGRGQEQILALLRARPADPYGAEEPSEPTGGSAAEASTPEPARAAVRSRRRKSVLLIDDEEASRRAALAALEQAEVPVRVAEDGGTGLAALAQERSDVIVLELGLVGALPGKDVINLIKATMEWVDIPIVLYTRLPVADQKEARTVHGADELVRKGAPGSVEALVAQIVALFRKG